jgi:sugar-specific transcriptional regulator TrmB
MKERNVYNEISWNWTRAKKLIKNIRDFIRSFGQEIEIESLPAELTEIFSNGLSTSFEAGTSHKILKNRVQMGIPDQMAGCALL